MIKPKPFLITGLPRSRTAWLSVAATTTFSICHHEPWDRMLSWEGAEGIWARSGFGHVGIADSALGFHLGVFLDRVGPRVLIVERDIREVEASLAAAFPDLRRTNYCDLLAARLRPYRDHPQVKTVRYDDLDDRDTVIDCLKHLIPGMNFAPSRIAELQKMNIQVHAPAFRARLAEFADAPAQLGADIAAEIRLKAHADG